MKNLNYLREKDLIEINAGGFWDGAFEIFTTVVKYSSLTGALITGIGDGILDALEQHQQNPCN